MGKLDEVLEDFASWEQADIVPGDLRVLIPRVAAVVRAADCLAGEVRGCLGMREAALRQELGNTNFSVLEHWAEEVRKTLDALAGDKHG